MKNNHLLLKQHLQNYHICFLQESKLTTQHQQDRFDYLAHNSTKSKQFYSSPFQYKELPKTGGLITIIHPDCPGASTARLLQNHTIPNRYTVTQIIIGKQELLLHNIYGPTKHEERKNFMHNYQNNLTKMHYI